jgi:hypothetical protein
MQMKITNYCLTVILFVFAVSCSSPKSPQLILDKSPISGVVAPYLDIVNQSPYQIKFEKEGSGESEKESPYIVVGLKSIKKFVESVPAQKNAIVLELDILDADGVKLGSSFRCAEIQDIHDLLISGNSEKKLKFYAYVTSGKDQKDFFKENELSKAHSITVKGNWNQIQGFDGTYVNEEVKATPPIDVAPIQGEGELGPEIGTIVVATSDKVYFYDQPNYRAKSAAYFVKGQTAEYIEMSDDNLEDQFLYVNFVYKGKVRTGYILISDIEFVAE